MNRVQVSVFFACVTVMILLPNVAGCLMFHQSIEGPCEQTASDARVPNAVEDASVELMPDAESSEEASVQMADASADREAPPNDSGTDPSLPIDAMTLSPSRCTDGTTHLPAGLFRPGFSVWQLCYTTQGSHQADAGETLARPSSVTFVRNVADSDEPIELIRYPAPARADPWTADVAIALPDPPTNYPLFGVRNDFPDGQIRWAVDRSEDGTALTTVGTIRIWRVYADGHKARYVPRVIANRCTDLTHPNPTLSGSFFPTGSLCPDALLECPANQYSCFGVY